MFGDSNNNSASLFMMMMNDYSSFEGDKTFPDYMFDKGVEMWANWKKWWFFIIAENMWMWIPDSSQQKIKYFFWRKNIWIFHFILSFFILNLIKIYTKILINRHWSFNDQIFISKCNNMNQWTKNNDFFNLNYYYNYLFI